MKKQTADAIVNLFADMKQKKDKSDKVAKGVKKLTKAEYDALPKALQKELKDMR
jgi:hypothetical protein